MARQPFILNKHLRKILNNKNLKIPNIKTFFTILISPLLFASCTKNNNNAPQNQTINCTPLLVDPVNLVPTNIDLVKNAKQFVFQAITIQKGMCGMLTTFTADSIKKYQFHVYVFTAGRYYPLPSTTTGSNKYGYAIVSNSAYATVNLTRSVGVIENFDAIKVVAVSLNYLLEQPYSIDYTDFASVQKTFGLP